MIGTAVAYLLRRLRANEGQGMVEYALIIVLIAVGAIVALTSLGGGITGVFTNITSKL